MWVINEVSHRADRRADRAFGLAGDAREAADALGMHCHYRLIEVAGADTGRVRALLDSVKRIGFAGINVTFPYKEAVVPLLDDLSPAARDRRGQYHRRPGQQAGRIQYRRYRL